MFGTIIKIKPEGYGFISAGEGPNFFFNRAELIDLEWGEQLLERRVQFEPLAAGKGPKALCVRPAK